MIQPTFRAFFVLLFFSISSPLIAQFQPRFGQVNVFIYKSKEDSLTMIAAEEATEKELQRKPVRMKKIDSLTQIRAVIYDRGTRKSIFLPERHFILTDSIKETTDLNSITRICVFKKNEIPAIVFKCKNLQELELVQTNINAIPKALSTLPSLTKLYIHHNRSTKRLKLPANRTISQLNIHVENPDQLPRSYKKFSNLQRLDLSESHIRSFPNGARKNRKLSEISLQRNEITLEGKIKKHKYLERLSLHENKIQHVPGSISKFQNLKKLNFNINSIRSVDDGLGKLQHLEQLSFYKNELTAIPKSAYQLKELGQIDLFYNQIETVDPEFSNWQKLHTLYLSYNKLTGLPENLDTLKNLTGLYVWENRLGALPENLSKMKALQYLRVNRNYLKAFPSGMENLGNLEEIDISHNYFEQLPESVFHYPNLKILAIVNNPWNDQTRKELPAKVAELKKREVSVHLSDND